MWKSIIFTNCGKSKLQTTPSACTLLVLSCSCWPFLQNTNHLGHCHQRRQTWLQDSMLHIPQNWELFSLPGTQKLKISRCAKEAMSYKHRIKHLSSFLKISAWQRHVGYQLFFVLPFYISYITYSKLFVLQWSCATGRNLLPALRCDIGQAIASMQASTCSSAIARSSWHWCGILYQSLVG